ncbi:hypothetical protein SUGI_0820190 [Cryptomeria japonica]|nr:hypothetical protein SUGI_0820190 [Cryptomeria japonica]
MIRKGLSPEFSGTRNKAKREVAAVLADLAFLTQEFCYINAIRSDLDYREETYTFYHCTEGKSYHGRGQIQLTLLVLFDTSNTLIYYTASAENMLVQHKIVETNMRNYRVLQVASIHFKKFIGKNWAPHKPGMRPWFPYVRSVQSAICRMP